MNLRLASHKLGELGTTSELTKGLLSYKAHFSNTVYATEEIWLTENDRLLGSLRSAIHEVEAALQNADYGNFEKQMLNCRRFEKDFLIRKDQRSYEQFSASVDRLLREALTDPNSFLLYDGIFRYRQAFEVLVQKPRFIGVDQSSGIRKALRESIQTVEAKLLTLSERAKTNPDENEHRANMLAGLVFAILLVSLGLVIKLGRVNKLLTAQSQDDRDAETTPKE